MNHEYYMQRCLELAAKGEGSTAPNPMVGCVIVFEDRIIAEGFHQQYGGDHAEVNAVNHMPDRTLLPQCTVYVNLEPCSHFGKTPPCADMLILLGAERVVVAALDPNPMVAGNGIKKLRDAGIEVTTGISESAAIALNKYFYTQHQKHRPYITLKWAQSADGFIGKEFTDPQFYELQKISGIEAHRLAHRLRANSSAIVIGGNTARNDNPSLTTRLWPGNNPMRVVVSKSGNLPQQLNIYNQEAKTLVITENINAEFPPHIDVMSIDFSKPIAPQIVEELYQTYRIQHLLVEGGSQLLQSFYDQDIYDEIYCIQNSIKRYQSGIKAPDIPVAYTLDETWGDDQIYHYQKS